MNFEEFISKSCVLDGKKVIICGIKPLKKLDNLVYCNFNVLDKADKLYETSGFINILTMVIFDASPVSIAQALQISKAR